MKSLTNQALIARIKKYQATPTVHSLTCGNDRRHSDLIPEERDGKVVLICRDCEYVQTKIPELFFEDRFNGYINAMRSVAMINRHIKNKKK